ncbi:Uma2 family endonuclease [Chondromyces crocatus]|uniref:Putative restriction endonuclease domain-containing protein n=1 Tax=Chondromyces crocatus TaxID=52 RepID=A0A0K1EMF0_CHOCO|nr:Uma2 family endonuclease [Chondromyces crocatus]AKT42065.1 uncharacterized protein CMC5_062880 [Chondromyces crocatus]
MDEPAEKRPARATSADLDAVPEDMIAELIGGVLYSSSRPGGPHTKASGMLYLDLGNPFSRGRGGPGGWWILPEPKLALGGDIICPDLAGWRRERMPEVYTAPACSLPPDWACEVLSPSTARHDRVVKMPLHAAAGVPWVWLLDPAAQMLEVFHLGQQGLWMLKTAVAGDAVVHAPPFEAVALELSALWIAGDQG